MKVFLFDFLERVEKTSKQQINLIEDNKLFLRRKTDIILDIYVESLERSIAKTITSAC